jgi:hypothetical protein
MTKFAPIGSVSHGTMRPEDLIPAFLDTLDELVEGMSLDAKGRELETCERVAGLNRRLGDIEQRMESVPDYFESEEADWDLETLFDLLNDFAPPYCHFGAHEGDGSDYGFWPSWESLNEDDYTTNGGPVLKIDAGDEWTAFVPEEDRDGIEYVLEVSDHGNATLRTKDGSEVWSIV